MGYGDLGCQGNSIVHTPNIDILANDGVRFTQWISADSLCTPSRGALLTGRLPIRIGLAQPKLRQRVFHPFSPGGLPLEEHTLAEALKERGYRTHLSGKWHLGIGPQSKFLPQNHGFDNYYGMPISNMPSCGKTEGQSWIQSYLLGLKLGKPIWLTLLVALIASLATGNISLKMSIKGLIFLFISSLLCSLVVYRFSILSPQNCLLFENYRIVQQPVSLANLTQRITSDANNFIDISAQSDKPFFLLLSYHKMHRALFSNEEFQVEEDEIYPNSQYLSNLRELDWSVGNIILNLKKHRIYKDTIIWFVSDNGPISATSNKVNNSDFIGSFTQTGYLRAFKGTIFEGGFRVPGIVVYKAKFPSGKVTNQAVGTMDIFPTSLQIIDDQLNLENTNLTYTAANPHTILDGKDMSPMLENLRLNAFVKSPHAEMIHYCGDVLAAVRIDSRYKVYFMTTDDQYQGVGASNLDCNGEYAVYHNPPLVYDLLNDIQEKNSLTARNFKRFYEILARAVAAVKKHNASKLIFPDRTSELKESLDIYMYSEICCNPPFCKCDYDS